MQKWGVGGGGNNAEDLLYDIQYWQNYLIEWNAKEALEIASV